MFKKRLYGIAFIVLLPLPLSAANVSVLVAETGLLEGVPPFAISSIWEGILLDVFFEGGHIVSNAPVIRLPSFPDKELPGEAVSDFYEAAGGGAEYFVLVILDYSRLKMDGRQKQPDASLRLFKIRPYKMIYKLQADLSKEKAINEDFALIKRQIERLTAYINE
ncbi:MAG: hypothetical protein LBQ88_01085 [Treponema sp.]|jgi:hypothetical protein|nr:hypothetical protein [Treponema sp.]